MKNKVKIIIPLLLISLSMLTSALMVVFITGCVKLSEATAETRCSKCEKVRCSETQNLGNSPTLKEIVEVAEGMEKR